MTNSIDNRPSGQGSWTADLQDFYRLSTGLKACLYDFDYVKTRKLLDPTWDEYWGIPNGHDIIADDVDIREANLLTSRHRDSDLHRVVLDLDYGARLESSRRLSLRLNHNNYSQGGGITQLLGPHNCKVTFKHQILSGTSLELTSARDLVLIPSSTPGHHHLILDVNLPWPTYMSLLRRLAFIGLIEPGYATASITRGFSAVRTPWAKKT